MTSFGLVIFTLKFMIPSVFTILFRAFGLGYKSHFTLILGLTVFAAYMIVVPATLIVIIGYWQFTHIVFIVMTIGAMAALIFSSDTPSKTILLVCYMVYFIALRLWAKPLCLIADNIHGRLTSHMMIPIVTTVMIYAIPVYPSRNFEFHPFYCTLMMLAVELAFFLYMYTLYRSLMEISVLSEHKLDAEILRLSAVSMAERLGLMDESAYQSSLAAHDHRHFNIMVLEFLEQGQFEEAAAFLRKQTEVKQTTVRLLV